MSDGLDDAGCWACDASAEWQIEPMDGGTVYRACGDGEDVFQAIATMVAHGAAQVVVQAWQPHGAGLLADDANRTRVQLDHPGLSGYGVRDKNGEKR